MVICLPCKTSVPSNGAHHFTICELDILGQNNMSGVFVLEFSATFFKEVSEESYTVTSIGRFLFF